MTRRFVVRALVAATVASATAIAVIVAPSCTIFNGVIYVEDAHVGSEGGGGEGGSGVIDHYLSLDEAARLCSRLMTCPEPDLVQTVILAVNVPLDPNNFSLCMTWAAGRIPKNHIGIEKQRGILKCAADATSCAAVGACSSEELYPNGDPRCASYPDGGDVDSGAVHCIDMGTSVERCDIPPGDALHCNNPYFVGSTCLLGDDDTLWCAAGKS